MSFAPEGRLDQDAVVFPLRLGSIAEFACVRAFLKSCQFDEPTLCRILKISEMADLSSINPQEIDLSSSAPATLTLLIRMFLFSENLRQDTVEQTIDSASLCALLALDLVRPGRLAVGDDEPAKAYYASVFLYPVAGLLIASDRHNSPDGSLFVAPPDIVFPAINGGTLLFLKLLPESRVEQILDIGSGTGVAALRLNDSAPRVIAADITARASHFAEFNRRLHGCHNVEVVCGDLYDPVAGQTFDRIVAHPPYIPSLSQTTIFRDGGETGEVLVRRIIEGLPTYLRAGGTYYSLCIGL